MPVIAEFTIPGKGFPLGQALETIGNVELTLERIVPIEGSHLPYVWVKAEDPEAFERQVATDQYIDEFVRLDSVEDETLYRIEWTETEHGLLNGIRETEAVIMEAIATDRWAFRLRFLDHDRLARFHDYCLDNSLAIELGRIFTATQPSATQDMFDLTPAQREALQLAIDRGYFDSPRAVTLSEIAEDLGVSKQAASQRIRRGNEKVLRESLTPIAR
jgi:hypothetical protein